MIKKLTLTTLFVMNAYSQCNIESFQHIIKFNKVLDNSVIKSSDCSDRAKAKFISFISDVEGQIPAKHLENIFLSEHQLEVRFTPKTMNIHNSGEFIKEQLNLNNTLVKDVRSLYGNASYNTESIETLRVTCSQCNSPGEKNLKLITSKKQIWLSANFLIKRNALILNSDITPFQGSLSKAIVSEKPVLDLGNDQLFNDYENIRFYKVNKSLLKGNILKQFDLVPKTLVKFNQNVEVIVKGSKVALKSRAISRESGRYGQLINLYNPKTKKVIKAKVIDFNKVMVEL